MAGREWSGDAGGERSVLGLTAVPDRHLFRQQ